MDTHSTSQNINRHSSTLTQTLTGEAHATGADISAGHVLAGASIHARVGFALIVVDVAVFTAPARVTQAFIADGEKTLEILSDIFSLSRLCYTISFQL